MNDHIRPARLTTGLFLAVLFGGGCAAQQPLRAASGSAFATRLYEPLRAEPGNLFFSPASLRMALTLLSAGARGATATQLRDGLQIGEDARIHAEIAARLHRWDALATGQPPLQLRVANQLWLQRELRLQPPFARLAAEHYGAPVVQLDFSQRDASIDTINRWVSDHTAHKVEQLLSRDDIDDSTRLVLTNTVYFKGRWQARFDPSATHPAPFLHDGHKVEVPLMSQSGKFRYAELDGGQLLELPYNAGGIVFDVILPAASAGLTRLEDALIAGALPDWLKHADSAEGTVELPRFHSSSRRKLRAPLQALGIVLPFSAGADFGDLSAGGPLQLADVVHEAVVDVDEQGTEAVAATAVVMQAPSVEVGNRRPFLFRADHPFVYVIRDRSSDEILFLGRLVDPSAQ
jgi:serpin B